MTGKQTAAQAMTAQLESIPAFLRPADDVSELLTAVAGKIDPAGGMAAAQQAAVIYRMLGPAAGYGDDAPPTSLVFPADHRLHLNCGSEWYWLGCHLDADGPDGPVRIAVLLDMLRYRLVSPAVQAAAGWSDADAQLVWNAVTVVVSGAKGSTITRRNLNVQWAPVGGVVEFPGERFVFRCGPDSLMGATPDVLPLTVMVDDGPNLTLELTVSTDMPGPSAFFLQGEKGITQLMPGIYYSWPQLKVSGRVTAADVTYEANGVGWIDHQLLAGATPKAPPLPAPLPVSGWNWCQFNFDNGEAFTAAAFQTGAIGVDKLVPYGFYVRRKADAWLAEPILGALAMDNLIPTLQQVMQPTSWTYTATSWPGALPASDIALVTAPWIADGSFQTANLAVLSEVPVSAAMVDRALAADGAPLGEAVAGRGYCESVGWEPRASYMQRAEAFLRAALSRG